VISVVIVGAGCGQPEERVEQPTNQVQSPVTTSPDTATQSPDTSQIPPVTTSTSSDLSIDSTALSTSSTSSATTSASGKVYKLDITQWGVTLILTRDIVDLQYSLTNDPKTGSKYAHFSTKSLIAKGGENCETDKNPLGTIVRAKKSITVQNDVTGVEKIQTIQDGDFYYYFSPPDPATSCFQNTTIRDLLNAQIKSFQQAANTLQLMQQ
jgi:hypothetical protein